MFHDNIFRSDELAADHYLADEPNGVLVITFTERTSRRLDIPGFGVEYLLKRGFDVIGVKSCRDLWYENLTPELLGRIAGHIETSGRRYTARASYGSSMGGYAAIRFSRELGVDRVLALSPVFSIKEPWDTRWKEDAAAMSPNPMLQDEHIRPSARYFLVYDPKCADRLHVERLSQIIRPERLVPLRASFSGHPSGYYLQQIGALDELAVSTLLHDQLPATLRQHSRNRANSDIYLYHLADELRRRHRFGLAADIIGRAVGISPRNPEHHMLHGRILEAQGDLDSAIAACSRAAVLGQTNPHFGLYRDVIARRQLKL